MEHGKRLALKALWKINMQLTAFNTITLSLERAPLTSPLTKIGVNQKYIDYVSYLPLPLISTYKNVATGPNSDPPLPSTYLG